MNQERRKNINGVKKVLVGLRRIVLFIVAMWAGMYAQWPHQSPDWWMVCDINNRTQCEVMDHNPNEVR